MTGDEYMSLLKERQRIAIEGHPWPTLETHGYTVKEYAKALMFPLEKMIQEGDEKLFIPPAKPVKPKPKPRYYRPATYWRERVTSLRAQMDKIITRGMPEKFDHAMVNLPLKGRMITDSQLDQYRNVSKKLSHAEYMLRSAMARESSKETV